MSDYPRMMYRKGGDDVIWGRGCATRIVDNHDEEAAAREAGFATTVGAAFGDEQDQQPVVDQDEVELLRMELQEARDTIAERDAEIKQLRDNLAAFDRDGDGKPGGSKRKQAEPAAQVA